MGTHRQRFLHNFPTFETLLRRETRVDSYHLMSGTCSLDFKNSEECAPTSVHDGFRHMMVLEHPTDVEVLYGNDAMVLCIPLRHFVVEVPSLSFDLEMGVCRTTSRFTTASRTLLATGKRALLASERALAFAIVPWVLYCISLAIRQEGLESHIDADGGVCTGNGFMFGVRLRLAHYEDVPVLIRTIDQVCCLRRPLDGTMQLDLEHSPQLLGQSDVLAIRGQLEIYLMLTQLNRMPPVRLLETWKANISNAQLFGSKKAFECFGESIREHLYSTGREMLPTMAFELLVQIIPGGECAMLGILLLDHRQHFIIEHARLGKTSEQTGTLRLIRIEAVLKRSHSQHFIGNQLNCQDAGATQPLPQTRNVPHIPISEERGFTARIDKNIPGPSFSDFI